MIAHQKIIREHLRDDHPVPVDFSKAEVREIELSLAKTIILKYEYLGTMGSARRAFGLFFDGELGGVECFGATGGTNTAQSICGPENMHRVMTISRGACVSWAHPHSASYLIARACKLMAREGKNIFIGYCDPDAGERGIIYRASNWYFCGMTNPKGSVFLTPGGLVQDERQISNLTRDRRAFEYRALHPRSFWWRHSILSPAHQSGDERAHGTRGLYIPRADGQASLCGHLRRQSNPEATPQSAALGYSAVPLIYRRRLNESPTALSCCPLCHNPAVPAPVVTPVQSRKWR